MAELAFNLSDFKSHNFTRFLHPLETLISNVYIQQPILGLVTEMAESEGNSQFEVNLLRNLCGPALAESLQNCPIWTTGRGNLLAAGPG